jgi:hypothetical protein
MHHAGKSMVISGSAATTTFPLSVELKNLAVERDAYADDIERRGEP